MSEASFPPIVFSDESTMTAQASTKMRFAVQHLFAAARFSRAVASIEEKHAGDAFGEFWEEILHNAVACILTSAASLEAYANELFEDRKKNFPKYSESLLDKLWESFERRSILEKFEFALLLMEKQNLDRGAAPYQNASILIDLRNALTHFKAEWMDEESEHLKLSNKLAGKFEPSPFVNDRLIFSRRWATHGCTEWAINSVKAFARDFERVAALEPKYDNPKWVALLRP